MSFYFLNSPQSLTKEQIGGKGYYLHQMAQDDLPIPQACFVSTQLWQEYRKNPKATTEKLKKDVIPQMVAYFKDANGGSMPLVSVRSAGAVSMPGMMDTILNVGVNQKYFKDLAAQSEETVDKGVDKTGAKTKTKGKKKSILENLADIDRSEEFAADVYARFLTMYGATVLGMDKDKFPTKKFRAVADVEVAFDAVYSKAKKELPSQKVEEQLLACILAVFNSWDNERAKLYRQLHNIDENAGTAVVIQRMVFGNKNDRSATGVMFSRNPSTGAAALTGEYLVNAQGEDVVSGSHTPKNMDQMESEFPNAYYQLRKIAENLETKYKQMQDIEFTIENDTVYVLQARTAKCSPYAKLKMLMDMYKFKEISAHEVLDRLSLKEYLDLNVKQVDSSFDQAPDGHGLAASMGAVAGRVVFGPSYKYEGEPTIFVAKETTPDDLQAIQLATGILTASGGATSHAAVVARGMGKVCVVGCADLKLSVVNGHERAFLGKQEIREGDWVTLDANSGKVWVGNDVPIIDASNSQVFWDLENLVLDAHPEWTRVTAKVDELIKENKSYFLTYELDDCDYEFLKTELTDAVQYLTGTMDLTGKLDYLQQKYPNQFLFADITAEQAFVRKKDLMVKLAMGAEEPYRDFTLYLGPYQEKYGGELRMAGYKLLDKDDVSFDQKNLSASLVIAQQLNKSIPSDKLAISSKNALLGVLK